MGNISIYKGTVAYWRGRWAKDPSGSSFIEKDTEHVEYHEYEFPVTPAKSIEQLVYILSRRIQEEKNLTYPVHIDWREIDSKIVSSIPDTSERFDTLTIK